MSSSAGASPAPASSPSAAPTAAQRHKADEAAGKLHRHAAQLAGFMWPKAVASVDECDPPAEGSTIIDCYWGQGVGGEDPMMFRVRLQADGALTKVLGNADPVPGAKSARQTAALLLADERLQAVPSGEHQWRCHRSARVGPSGEPLRSDATGQLCSTYFRRTKTYVRRYVEFARDGTAVRDYKVRTGS